MQHTLLGTYQTPRFAYGATVFCEIRGDVIITGLTHARIPWPLAKRPKCRARTLVMYGDLFLALQRESASAIC